MSAFKDGATTIRLGGKDYKMVYSLAVMDKAEEKHSGKTKTLLIH